jgi:hypothetical protein
MKTEVRVSKAGAGGIANVQVALPSNATPDQIASAIKAVYVSPDVYRVGGLPLCLHCKSGINVTTVASFPESIFVDSE